MCCSVALGPYYVSLIKRVNWQYILLEAEWLHTASGGLFAELLAAYIHGCMQQPVYYVGNHSRTEFIAAAHLLKAELVSRVLAATMPLVYKLIILKPI